LGAPKPKLRGFRSRPPSSLGTTVTAGWCPRLRVGEGRRPNRAAPPLQHPAPQLPLTATNSKPNGKDRHELPTPGAPRTRHRSSGDARSARTAHVGVWPWPLHARAPPAVDEGDWPRHQPARVRKTSRHGGRSRGDRRRGSHADHARAAGMDRRWHTAIESSGSPEALSLAQHEAMGTRPSASSVPARAATHRTLQAASQVEHRSAT